VADGQAIVIATTTQVLFKPTNREKKLIKQQQKKASDAEANADEDGFEPLTSLDQVAVGMVLTYEGIRSQDGTEILASRIEFSRNDLEDGEARLWKSLKASVKGAESLNGGELKISQVGKFKLLPAPTVQEYVASIGRKLAPPYQSRLSATDPSRIPFQFYVVRNDEANAFALPNGIVVVNSGLIELLDNEAQLAAVIGHEMAHATHEHTWRQQNYKKKTRIGIALAGAVANAYGMKALGDVANLVNAALINGYSRNLENQADRVGLEYMTAAGYDPREAPAVWKLMTKKYGLQPTDFFYSNHDNHAVRRSYLMNELKNNYRGVDFSALRTNGDEYERIKAAVAAAKNPKRKLKVS
jgi:Zn-dependent protease with chaperone function